MSTKPQNHFCGQTRREFLWQTGAGFTTLGLIDLFSKENFFTTQAYAADGVTPFNAPSSILHPPSSSSPNTNPLAPKPPHFAPKAKSVIFLFMYGGPSHVDTFDHKPELYKLDGKTIQVKTKGRGGPKSEGRVVGPSGTSSPTANPERWSPTSSRTWASALTTSPSSTP
jgi:Protein of unknown function (DUF1501)